VLFNAAKGTSSLKSNHVGFGVQYNFKIIQEMKSIQKIYSIIALLLLISCSTSEEDIVGETGGSTIAKEIDPAKSFYSSNGATFKFRLYQWAPTEGETGNNNNHAASIHRIIDDNGFISIIADYWNLAFSGPGAVLDCKGDYISQQTSTVVGLQKKHFTDEFEILDKTRLISYNATDGAHGAYGFVGLQVFVHNPVYFSGAISSSSVQGYMFTINDRNFMLSMGFNSNYGHPMLYNYIPTNYTWSGAVVSQMDAVWGSGVNIPTTNDASKVGNPDKVFWAWLSYNTSQDNGKINLISYNGSSFSNVTSLDGIGRIGKGITGYRHGVTLHKNPNNLSQPYMVVKHYDEDILDIYKFTGTAIEVVKTGVSLPASIPIISGTLRTFKEIKFTGNNVYLITGKYNDKNLYKLSGSTFVIDKANLTLDGEYISAIESTTNGVLISVVKTLPTKPQPKTVSDVVLIPN
jgi:hypothetical protein